jgi:hypothetical protein
MERSRRTRGIMSPMEIRSMERSWREEKCVRRRGGRLGETHASPKSLSLMCPSGSNRKF